MSVEKKIREPFFMPGIVEGFVALFWLSLAALSLLAILFFFGVTPFVFTAVAAVVVTAARLLS